MANTGVAIRKSSLTSTAVAMSSTSLVASGTFNTAGNSADVQISMDGGATFVAMMPDAAFPVFRVDLANVYVKAASGTPSIFFGGDNG